MVQQGGGGGDLGNQRWDYEKQEIDRMARDRHLRHEAEEADARNAEEAGTPVPAKKPWWKFWA